MKNLKKFTLVGLLALAVGTGFKTWAKDGNPKIEVVKGLCDDAKKKLSSSFNKVTSAEGITYTFPNGSSIFLSNEVKEKLDPNKVNLCFCVDISEEKKDYVVEFNEETKLPVLVSKK